MKLGNWNYRLQNPIYFWGQHDEFYPHWAIVLRSPIAREWAGKPQNPPF